jgi:glutamate-1-semialdehyde 2,1-aminomutase
VKEIMMTAQMPETAPRSARLYERAVSVMPGGNTRTTVYFAPHPLYAEKGQGCIVTDIDGVARIDAINNFTALIHGHGRAEILAAVTDQLMRGTCFGMPTASEIELAELLCARLPAVEQLRFTNSGTEAVMSAIKAARAYTGRPMIAKCEGAYHGTYDFAEVSESSGPDSWGDRQRPKSVASSRGTPSGVLDDVIVLPFNDVEASEHLLRSHATRLAGILIDPMPNRAGLIPATPDFLAMLRRVANETGALLIFDEVISFRLGFHGAQGRFAARPDLTVLGKIIGGGFPVGAVGGRAEIMSVFDPSKGKPSVPHGGTFTANPITMVAGHAAMQLLTPAVYDTLAALGDRLQQGFEAVLRRHDVKGQVSGLGSMRRIHFVAGELRDYRSIYAGAAQACLMQQLHRAMLKNGVIIAPTGLMALSTAMATEDIDVIVRAFDLSLGELSVSPEVRHLQSL